jgi:Concanavalin A-like lectin/glucanases superfamily
VFVCCALITLLLLTVLSPLQLWAIAPTRAPTATPTSSPGYWAYLWYSFETGTVSGTSLTNLGNGRSSTATLLNGASVSTSDYAVGTGALYLDASKSQYVRISSFTFTNGISISLWFKANSVTTGVRIFDFGNGAPSNNIVMYFSNDNLAVLTVVDSYNYNKKYADNVVSSVNDNTWRHIVWTIDSSGNWAIYLNGNIYWYGTSYNYPNTVARSYNYIGKSSNGDPYYDGYIDDFGMYQLVLTANDVLNIYSYGAPTLMPSNGNIYSI